MTAAARPPLLIGLGNELRGDDAAGLLVARAVRDCAPGRFAVAEHAGEPIDLLDLWAGAETAIVVDAIEGGADSEPGTLHRFDAGAAPLPAEFGAASTHALGLAETVELARALDRLPAELTVLGIEGERFATGSAPSPLVLAAVERLAETAVAELR